MKKILALLFFSLFIQLSFSQNVVLDWAKSIGNTSNESCFSVVTDSNGNVYSTGEFQNTVDFDPNAGVQNITIPSNHLHDVYVQKLDKDGNYQWAFGFGQTLQDSGDVITIDSLDNIYVVGSFSNSPPNMTDFDPGVGVVNLDALSYGGKFIAKYNTNGNLIWAKNFGILSGQTFTNDITIDINGNILLTGWFENDFNTNTNAPPVQQIHSFGNKDIFVMKLDSNGDKIWAYNFGGTDEDKSYAIKTDSLGNIYFAGYFNGTADFDFTFFGDTNNIATGTNEDAFLTKLNPNGTIVWAKQINTSNFSKILSIDIDSNDNIFVAGDFNGIADFDLSTTDTFEINGLFAHQSFICRYDTNGDLAWVKTIHTGFSTISISANDFGVYSSGSFAGNVDFDTGATTFFLNSGSGTDVFTHKLDTDGNFVWAKKIGNSSNVNSNDIYVDKLDNIHTVGTFRSTLNFDPNAGTTNLTSNGQTDIYMQKLTPTVFNAPYCESFENNAFFTNYWEQEITDDFDWTRHTGSTTSTATGPTAAIDGSYYIYTETSFPRIFGDQAIIYSPEISITNLTTPTLEFNYHMYGAGMDPDGTIDVAISTNNGVTWTSIFNQVANHGNQWNYFNTDLTPYIGNNVKFRITGIISTMTGNVFENDFAIDNFCVQNNSQLEHFVTTWNTTNTGTSNNTSITIPTKNTETYNYDVDWDNDGVFDEFGLTGNVVHNFGAGNGGIKTIKIRGDFPSIYFNGSFDKNKILQVNQWGKQKWTTMSNAFRACINLDGDATDVPDLSICTNMGSVFDSASIFNGDISNWNVSNITTLRRAFTRAFAFNQNISNWNVSKVTSMFKTFQIASQFNQNLANWNIESVTDMGSMLSHSNLSTLNYDNTLIGWQSQNVMQNVPLGAVTLQYCLSVTQRQDLIDNASWIITGDLNGCDDCSAGLTIWNGSSWSNGLPNLLKSTRIEGNYETNINGSFDSCDCQILGGVSVNIRNGDYINTNSLHSNGNLIIDNNGSFVQNSNTATIGGIGYFRMDRSTTPYAEYDYTYWSSPTAIETINNVFNTNSTLIAGASDPNAVNDDNFSSANNIYWFNAQNFNDNNNDTFDDEGNDWQQATGAMTMTPGVGYIAMGAGADFPFNTNFAVGLQQNVYFEGRFNTGNIIVPVYQDNSNTDSFQNQNLIGNPYPSALDINKLMKDNLTTLQGTFYFWTHDSPISGSNPGPNAFDFTNNDYAVATSNGTAFNFISNGSAGSTPRPYIASGQSIMANVLNAGNVIINNDMRSTIPNQSYRNINVVNIDRAWINLTNQEGIFRQLMIGFYENGTVNFDNGLDGERNINGNNYDFFSIIENDDRRFAIQTQDDFDISKEIPLGIEIVDSGIFTISIDSLEGIFTQGQQIYLQDNETHIIHNLSESNYDFYIEATADLKDRFVLRFTDESLSIDDNSILREIIVYPNPSQGIFNLKWKNNLPIIYKITDLTGKIIINNITILNATNTTIDLATYSKGVYFIELKQNNKKVVKKLVVL